MVSVMLVTCQSKSPCLSLYHLDQRPPVINVGAALPALEAVPKAPKADAVTQVLGHAFRVLEVAWASKSTVWGTA